MLLSRWFYGLSVSFLFILFLLLGFSWYVMYQSAITKIQEDVQRIVEKTAEQVQNKNLSLNNLVKALDDKDYDRKTAFAIGMTQNQAKLGISFENNTIDTDESLPNINRKWLDSNHIKFIPSVVKKISYFDSHFNIELKKAGLTVPYQIQKIETHITPSSKHASGLFIINFYDPDVYQVTYQISAVLLIKRLAPYTGISLFLLLLLISAFGLYRKSYRLQMQMAQFKQSLFSNVTHELKTPLSSLQLIITSFKDEEQQLSAKQKEYIDFAASELQRMNLLIEKILSFGKLNKEQFALNKEIINVPDLVREAVQVMNMTAGSKNAQIIFESAQPIDVIGDKILLLNLLVSILDNAVKYTVGKPEIHISLAQDKDEVTIMIRDNGPGIHPKFQSKIFEPFFRVPTGNEHSIKGHGLGLSFAQQVAELHSGKIFVTSEQGKGSTFIIMLPS